MPRLSPEALAELARLIQAAGGKLKGNVLKPIADLVRERMPLPLTEQGVAEESAELGRVVRGLVKNYEPRLGKPEKALTPEDTLQEALTALVPQVELLPQARALTGKSTRDIVTNPLRNALQRQELAVGLPATGTESSEEIARALARMATTDPAMVRASPEDIVQWLKAKGYGHSASRDMVLDALESRRPEVRLGRIDPRTERPVDVGSERVLDVAALKGNPDWVKVLIDRLNETLPGLPDKQRVALDLRFGLTGEPSTLEGVGKALGMTRPGAAKNINTVLESLRKQLGVHVPETAGPGGAQRMLVNLRAERDAIDEALRSLDAVRRARGGPVKLDQEELALQARKMQLDQLMAAQLPPKRSIRTSRAGGEFGNPEYSIPDRGRVLSRGELRVRDVPRGEFRRPRVSSESGPVRRYSPEELAAENQRRSLRQIFDLAE